jgi:hypothetical protein
MRSGCKEMATTLHKRGQKWQSQWREINSRQSSAVGHQEKLNNRRPPPAQIEGRATRQKDPE